MFYIRDLFFNKFLGGNLGDEINKRELYRWKSGFICVGRGICKEGRNGFLGFSRFGWYIFVWVGVVGGVGV